MQSEPPGITRHDLRQALATLYHLEKVELRFLPVGEESYGYLVSASSGQYFLKLFPPGRPVPGEELFVGIQALYESGLEFVLPALPTHDGEYRPAIPPFAAALFPLLPGPSGWEQPLDEEEWREAARLIARLHNTRPPLGLAPCDPLPLPFAPTLRQLLDGEYPEPRTNLQRQAQSLLARERSEVATALDALLAEAQQFRESPGERVLVHGDPNLANLVRDASGRLRLIDWSVMQVGPPERDLFFFTGPRFPAVLQEYRQVRPEGSPRAPLFRFYLYHWALQEIADYASRLLLDHVEGIEAEHSWRELCDYLPIRRQEIEQGYQETATALKTGGLQYYS